MILGLDPGVQNFAYSVTYEGILIDSGLVQNTVTDLKKGVYKQINSFLQELHWLPECNKIYAERFISRGLRGHQGELISVMLGAICTHYDATLMVSSTWKNEVNKAFDLRMCYKAFAVVPHLIDATLISMWGTDKRLLKDRKLVIANMELLETWYKSRVIKKPIDFRQSFVR